jgi:hypothetical protein
MTTAHFIMQAIAYVSLGIFSTVSMFGHLTLTGVPGAAVIKFLVRVLGFLGCVWLILELLKVQY